MKVLGKEVNSCDTCYLSRLFEDSTSGTDIRCGWNNLYIFDAYEHSYIHKDCPFSKPITSEVIESYGFKNCNFTINSNFTKYSKSIDNISHWLLWYNIEENVYTIEKVVGGMYLAPFIKFVGKINNPVELEFILKSFGSVS